MKGDSGLKLRMDPEANRDRHSDPPMAQEPSTPIPLFASSFGEAIFSIRKATSGDVDRILDCLRDAFSEFDESYTPAAFLDTVLTPSSLQDRLQNMVVFVATNNAGEIVGSVACNNSALVGHIRGMSVRSEWQGAGVAAHLLASVESELRDRNCSLISLGTTLPLRRAMRFYERHGFTQSGVVSDFFGMPLYEYVKAIRP